MLSILISKEIKALLLTPKFTVTLTVCSILLFLSIFVGIREYQESVRLYEMAQQIENQNFQEARNAMAANALIHRKPTPIQIFFSGVHFDIGRLSSVTRWTDPELTRSIYSETPIFALFRMLDFGFIVQVILTLFALLFTYDSVTGERESGTLKLLFSNSVTRKDYFIAKFVGSSIALIIPLLIPLLFSLLLIQINRIDFSFSDWISLGTGIFGAVVLLLVYLVLGITISVLNQKSSHSFLILITFWIFTVVLAPRAGVLMADSLIHSPSDYDLAVQKSMYRDERMREHGKELSDLYEKRNEPTQGMSRDEAKAYRESKEWEWAEEDEELRNKMNSEIDDFAKKLAEEALNSRTQKNILANELSFISPAAVFQFMGNTLAQTDYKLKQRYTEELNQYKTVFANYIEEKQKASGQPGGIRITMDTETGFKLDLGRNDVRIDFSDRPVFNHPYKSISQIMNEVTVNLSVLLIYFLILVLVGYQSFLKSNI